MPNPELINGNYYLRLHVPKDLATKAKGTTVAIPVGDAIRYQKVGSVVKVSLQTKVAAEAKQRFTQALAAVEAHWDSLRRGPVKLTHKQCVGLAGELYSDFVRVSDDNPGPPDLWKQIRMWDEEAKTPRLRPIETLMVPKPKPNADWSVEKRFGGFADVMLQRHKLQVADTFLAHAKETINPTQRIPILVEDDSQPLWEADAIACRLSQLVNSDFWRLGADQPDMIRWISWGKEAFVRACDIVSFETGTKLS